MGKSTIFMAIFHSYVSLPEVSHLRNPWCVSPTDICHMSQILDILSCVSAALILSGGYRRSLNQHLLGPKGEAECLASDGIDGDGIDGFSPVGWWVSVGPADWNRVLWLKVGLNYHELPILSSFDDRYMNWLVGGLEHVLFFHIVGIIAPTEFHILQRGRSTTNQIITSSFGATIPMSRDLWKFYMNDSRRCDHPLPPLQSSGISEPATTIYRYDLIHLMGLDWKIPSGKLT